MNERMRIPNFDAIINFYDHKPEIFLYAAK